MAAMAGHSVICREATPDERAEIAAQLKVAWGAYGCLMLFAAFAVGALGGVAGWIAERISADAGAVGRWTGWVIGGVLWVWLLIRCVREERRRRRGLLQEAAEGRVQQVSVTDPRVVSLEAVTESDPALVFDIGEGRLLLLQGNWLYDEKTYGAPPVEDEHEDFLNGLPAPHRFRARRSPSSGCRTRAMF